MSVAKVQCTVSGTPTQFTLTGVPAAVQPTSNQNILVSLQSGGVGVLGECQLVTSQFNCHFVSGATFTTTMGLGGSINSSNVMLTWSSF
jgi:hypothetical protein